MASKARDIADLGSNDVLETTSTGLDVTGTVQADGLTSNGDITVGAGQKFKFNDQRYFTPENNVDGAEVSANGKFTVKTGGTPSKSLVVDADGGVEFFEDTGTTAKMVWDASAESLKIGSPAATSGAIKQNFFEVGGKYSTNSADSNQYQTIGFVGSTGFGVTDIFTDAAGEKAKNFYMGLLADAPYFNANRFGIVQGGVERVTIEGYGTNAGNVGIGTASPSDKLHLSYNSATSSGVILDNSNPTVNGGTRVSFRYSGVDTGYIRNFFNGGDFSTEIQANADIRLKVGSSERARLDSSGNLLIGTTSGDFNPKMAVHSGGRSYALEVKAEAGTTAPLIIRNDNGASGTRNQIFFLYGGTTVGSITSTSSSTIYGTSSDERLKENIQDTTHTVDINDIQVREFDWKVDGSHQRYGFIAQELETVYPEAVHSPEDTDEMKSVDYSKLVPLLVKEIQQLKAEIKELKA